MKTLTAALLLSALALSRASGETPAPAGDDPIARYLFPPERVLGAASEIGLEDSQRNAIRGEVHKVQSRFLDLQFDLQEQSEKLIGLLQEKPIDEARVLAEVDRVLAIEKDVKKAQITLLIHIKNLLTPAQQKRLAEIQAREKK